jgi:hypothetical protein
MSLPAFPGTGGPAGVPPGKGPDPVTGTAAVVEGTDPALVAAEAALVSPALTSGTAAAALGAGVVAGVPGAPAPGSVPGSAPAPPPVSPTSRYATTGTANWVAPDGRVIAYLRRRPIPPPEALAGIGFARVEDGDRADLLASRVLGDADQWWRLADANLAERASDLEEPGRLVRVALPEGFPGGEL